MENKQFITDRQKVMTEGQDAFTATTHTPTPMVSNQQLSNSYWYLDRILLSVLTSSKQTNGAFSIVQATETKGLEAPPHIHTGEDETFYLLDGAITFYVGGKELRAQKGDVVFLPRNILHHLKVETPTSEVIIFLSPGGFEDYFIEMSKPAREVKAPPMPQGSPDLGLIVKTASKYGALFPTLSNLDR